MELFWTPEAILDRDDIYTYIELDDPAAALDLDELFEEKAGLLIDHPFSDGLDAWSARGSWSRIEITY